MREIPNNSKLIFGVYAKELMSRRDLFMDTCLPSKGENYNRGFMSLCLAICSAACFPFPRYGSKVVSLKIEFYFREKIVKIGENDRISRATFSKLDIDEQLWQIWAVSC